ncbi:MAG: type I restriction endonuclease subunit R [candidate division KSB1 bacterium]|nr:type I restriction endonuclease subunit R [candidate division KSB1 bacterium]
MTPSDYTEDNLVQRTTAEYLKNELKWDSVYAYNREDFGPDSLLGRASDRDVVLTRYLRQKLIELNPALPENVYDDAVRQIVSTSSMQSLIAVNREKYELLRKGLTVTFRDENGKRRRQRLRLIDFEHPLNNHFLCVRELWVQGDLYHRRADIVGFVNGLPLLFMELKNLSKDIRAAYEKNFKDYLTSIPHLFHHNAFVVLANGIDAKMGSMSSRFEHFFEWKRLHEDEAGAVDMETLLKGVCEKHNFIDLLENFIVFDDSTGDTKKILARNHQFLGVNRAVDSVIERKKRDGKLGVFWHTQGAGKSYSMVFFSRKIHRKLGGNFTFLILTDRQDLDTQIYKTFAGCGVVNNDRNPCRATSCENLEELLSQHKSHIFSLIQKFSPEVKPHQPYTERDDIIVITDEAHRTQYGTLALNMRNALPNASYIGFTGTPLFKNDQITKQVFGDYISTYDFQRAVEDKATVPLYYDARGDKLGVAIGDLNERIAEKLEELEIQDVDVQQRLEQELRRDYHIVTAQKRLDQVARDFVEHYSVAGENGKAMLVCIDKITCVRMYDLIEIYWQQRISRLEADIGEANDDQEEQMRQRHIDWMRQARMAVVVSEEQGEVEKFEKWDLNILPHRKLIKDGIDLTPEMRQKPQFSNMQRMALDDAFKQEEHPFRIAIVCAMWLTGFDVPCLSTLYLDKPLKAHTLMQAIARANRVNKGKNNGMIVDYCGILRNLRQALATFSGTGDQGREESSKQQPAAPNKKLLDDLVESIQLVREFLSAGGASLQAMSSESSFERNAAIRDAKEAANENDETRKRFEVLCRAVFTKFKACLTIKSVNEYRIDYQAISFIYKCLQKDSYQADITDILRSLHTVVDEAIEMEKTGITDECGPYDISQIDFERLRQEFERHHAQHTTVKNLKTAVEQRLERLLQQNPMRTDFQRHYEDIVAAYNREKDRATIEQTFEELLKFVEEMDQEQSRAAREGLTEEQLAVFDLLKKPDLSPRDIERIKGVSKQLLETLKKEQLRVDHWTDKESTRDAVQVAIRDFLWSEKTGLPVGGYTEQDVTSKANEVFIHVRRVYETLPSPFYEQTAA